MKGKVAIVTGASRGIGKAIALAYAKEGATVIVAARSETAPSERLPGSIHETVEQIEALGGRALAVRCDVTDEAGVNAMVEQTLAEFGRVDVLVNNAAVDFPAKVVDMSAKRWEVVFRVGMTGPFLCSKAVLPAMIAQRSGQHHQHHLPRRLREGHRHRGLQRRLRRVQGGPGPLHLRPGGRGGAVQYRRQRRHAGPRHRHRGHEHVGHRGTEEDLRRAGDHGGRRSVPGQAGRLGCQRLRVHATTSTSCGTGWTWPA